MGQQIGLQCAMYGYDVVYHDLSQQILDSALKRVAKLGSWYVSSGRLTEEKLRQNLASISATPDPEKAQTDFISESVPEDPELKGKIFTWFHKLCPERTAPPTPLCSSPPCLQKPQEGLKNLRHSTSTI
jgi:3-hydroxybutyryl-CoA dehydrogenase